MYSVAASTFSTLCTLCNQYIPIWEPDILHSVCLSTWNPALSLPSLPEIQPSLHLHLNLEASPLYTLLTFFLESSPLSRLRTSQPEIQLSLQSVYVSAWNPAFSPTCIYLNLEANPSPHSMYFSYWKPALYPFCIHPDLESSPS
jgi:hypothetical protein